jgi:peptidoglycan glycosyltransferase
MNRPLRRMSAAVMLLFGLLLVNVNYLQAFEAGDLQSRPGNARQILKEYDRQRGPILINGRAVAASTPTDDSLKYLRRYRNGPLFAHVTGYYSFVYGATAIERAQNDILAGTDDRLAFRRAVDVLTGREQEGGSVALTINPAAQRAAMQGLRDLGGDVRGAVAAVDPSTGAVLAMVSTPTFDPNELSTHDGAAIREAYAALDGDEAQPLLNRALNQRYPPGSTFKIVTAAAALESGRYTPDGDVPGPAVLDLPLTTAGLPNYDNAPCSPGSDTTTLIVALQRSCNTTFGAIGMELGPDALREQAEAFGFNSTFEIPMTSAESGFPTELNEPQTAQSSIGQYDVTATPLQMAMVVAGVANGGVVMKPYLVEEVRAPDTSTLEVAEPEELGTAMSPATAATLTDMLVSVVEDGTGTNAQIDGVRVAGKTGTAQQGGDRPPHAWFVAFAPAEAGAASRVAVAVVIEDGGGQAEISGNQLAAPIARSVMQAVLGR